MLAAVVRRLPLLPLALSILSAAQIPVPRFTDPERRSKLMAALPEVEKIFERYRRDRGTPGLVYGVVIDGELVAVKSFGVRERNSNDPVTPDTIFRIASMTKSFTALAVLKLRDEGKLSLEDPVSKYIPEFGHLPLPTRDSGPIRVRHLLTHGTGLPEDNPWGDRQLGVGESVLDGWLRQGLPFSTAPDTTYEYSNYGFALAGRVVAKASGMSYRDYIDKRILQPLGMKATTLAPSEAKASLRATGYGRNADGYFEIPSLPHGAFGAMGGMLTSARDLARYVAFHLSAWPARDDDDRGPVRRASVREMNRLQRSGAFNVNRGTPDGPLRVVAGGYGFGLNVSRDCRFEHLVGHGGGLPGFGSYMSWLPAYGVGMFAMANLTYAGPFGAISESLDVFRKTGALKPRALPAAPVLTEMRDSIVQLYSQWNDARAEAMAADNLFLDVPAADRRKQMEQIKARVGACAKSSEVNPENALRGRFRMDCERGSADVIFTLAPTTPPRIQFLAMVSSQPPSESIRMAAIGLTSLIGTWSRERFDAVASSSLDAGTFQRQTEAVRASHGSCRLGEPLGGDGQRNAVLRLDCERAPLDLRLTADQAGRVERVLFTRPESELCVP